MKYVTAPARWLWRHPTAMVNLLFLLLATVGFFYFLTKPIDVLENWSLATTKQAIGKELPVYYPGGTLEFTSKSTKLISAQGTTTRIFDCDATPTEKAREINLTPLVANRAPGVATEKENSIIVPGVSEFKGLPRVCRLVINVCYDNVILWRDHCETAKTNDFSVQEKILDTDSIKGQIESLREQIKVLENEALVSLNNSGTSSTVDNNNGTSTTTTRTTTNNNTTIISPSPVPAPSPSVTTTPTPQQTCAIDLLGIKLLCS